MPKGVKAELVETACQICETSFMSKLLQTGPKKYCSNPCAAIGSARARSRPRVKSMTTTCKHCGRPRQDPAIRDFCSQECKAEAKSLSRQRTCTICSTPFEGDGRSKYCSQKCLRLGTPPKTYTCASASCDNTFEALADLRKKYCSKQCASDSAAQTRNLDLDFRYFKSIDTKEKAYWLGFLYADGYVNTDRGTMRLKLALKDEDQVDRFIAALRGDGIKDYSQKGQVAFYVFNGGFCRDLAAQGCGQNKTKTVRLPDLGSDELDLAFLLGHFDGDGWRQGVNSGDVCSGSIKMLEDIKRRWSLPGKLHPKDSSNTCWTLQLGSELYRRMLENYVDSMPRKRNDHPGAFPLLRSQDRNLDGLPLWGRSSDRYPEDFKAYAVDLLESSEDGILKVARGLGVSSNVLRSWRDSSRRAPSQS